MSYRIARSYINKELNTEKVMKSSVRLWHVTPLSNVKAILEKGLLPAIGIRAQKIQEARAGVYCFKSGISLKNALTGWLGEEFEDTTLCVLEVSVDVEIDDLLDEGHFEVVLREPVSPGRIRVLVENVDEWLGEYPHPIIPENWER